jgi:TrkA domain protein
MTEIHRTRLPGVGVRYDFMTGGGERLGVIAHHSGRRELMICSRDDPDTCRDVVRLEEDDVRALAEVLGVSPVTEEVDAMRLQLQGLSIEWLPVDATSAGARATLHDIEHRDETAASIVGILRHEEMIASPPSDFRLQPGDTAVVIGTNEGVRALSALLRGG